MRNAVPQLDGQLHAVLKIEKSDGSMLKFLSDNPFGRQAKAILVEAKCAFEIIYAKRDHGEMRFHGLFFG